MSWKDRKGLDAGLAKKGTDFLFDSLEDKDWKILDVRTDIGTEEMFKTIAYYRLLGTLECKIANDIADLLERLLISTKRMGRLEAVTVLKQSMPKQETLLQGIADVVTEEITKE